MIPAMTDDENDLLTLADARKLATRFRSEIEAGGDPHDARMEQRLAVVKQRQAEIDKERLDVERMWETYMQQVASQLRTRVAKDRVFRKYVPPHVEGLYTRRVHRSAAPSPQTCLISQKWRFSAGFMVDDGLEPPTFSV